MIDQLDVNRRTAAKAWFASFVRGTLLIFGLLLSFELSLRLSHKTGDLLNSLGLWVNVREILSSVVALAFVNLPLGFAEWLCPGTTVKRNYLAAAKFWLAYLVVAYGWSKIAVLLTAKLGLVPAFAWKIDADSGGALHPIVVALGILVPLWAFDFFYYWFHRAQHRFEVLWRFHRVHHSIVHLNCLNSYHHVFEEMFRFPFIAIPMALLLKVDVPQLVLLSAFVGTWGHYIHSDTRIHLGAFGSVFGDNANHRIHHSIKHFNKNFAAVFPIWDMLFGTYQKPERDKFPPVGLESVPPPRSVFDYLIMPLRRTQSSRPVSHSA